MNKAALILLVYAVGAIAIVYAVYQNWGFNPAVLATGILVFVVARDADNRV